MDFRRLNLPLGLGLSDTAESMLYEMIMAIQVSANPFTRKEIEDQGLVDPRAISTVRRRLQALKVDYQLCDVDLSEIDFKDISSVARTLYFFGIELHSRNFLAGYVVSGDAILAKFENL